MKKLLSLFVLLIAGSVLAGSPQNSQDGTLFPGAGVGVPSERVRKGALSGRGYGDVKILRGLVQNTATPLNAPNRYTATPTVVSTGEWFDTSAFSAMTLVMRVNGQAASTLTGYNNRGLGSATLLIWSAATQFTGSGTPFADYVGVPTDLVVVTNDTVTITALGAWTRVQLVQNTAVDQPQNSGTVSVDAVLRYGP